jgi:hypothetical protein
MGWNVVIVSSVCFGVERLRMLAEDIDTFFNLVKEVQLLWVGHKVWYSRQQYPCQVIQLGFSQALTSAF